MENIEQPEENSAWAITVCEEAYHDEGVQFGRKASYLRKAQRDGATTSSEVWLGAGCSKLCQVALHRDAIANDDDRDTLMTAGTRAYSGNGFNGSF